MTNRASRVAVVVDVRGGRQDSPEGWIEVQVNGERLRGCTIASWVDKGNEKSDLCREAGISRKAVRAAVDLAVHRMAAAMTYSERNHQFPYMQRGYLAGRD